jgi:hypothetical protein
MMPDTDRGRPPVNTDNRAYQRFRTTVVEHLELVTWTTTDGIPLLLSLIDLDSGDAITLALLDSHEIREPHILVAVSVTACLTTHGPFDGSIAAASQAPLLAIAEEQVAATRPLRLHNRHAPVAGLHWVDIPDLLNVGFHPARLRSSGCVVLLVDRGAGRLAAVGPFAHPATARAWSLRAELPTGVDPITVPLLPTPHVPALLTNPPSRDPRHDTEGSTRDERPDTP